MVTQHTRHLTRIRKARKRRQVTLEVVAGGCAWTPLRIRTVNGDRAVTAGTHTTPFDLSMGNLRGCTSRHSLAPLLAQSRPTPDVSAPAPKIARHTRQQTKKQTSRQLLAKK